MFLSQVLQKPIHYKKHIKKTSCFLFFPINILSILTYQTIVMSRCHVEDRCLALRHWYLWVLVLRKPSSRLSDSRFNDNFATDSRGIYWEKKNFWRFFLQTDSAPICRLTLGWPSVKSHVARITNGSLLICRVKERRVLWSHASVIIRTITHRARERTHVRTQGTKRQGD